MIKKLVDDNLLLLIKGTITTKAMLDILEAQLVAKNTVQFIATICKLFSLKKKPKQSVAMYFTELNGLIMLTVADAAEDIQHCATLLDPNALMVGQLLLFMITYSNNLLQCYITKHTTAVTLARLPEEYEMARAIIRDWPEFDMNCTCTKISECEAEIACADSPSIHGSSDKLLYMKGPDACGLYCSSAHHGQWQGTESHCLCSNGNCPALATGGGE